MATLQYSIEVIGSNNVDRALSGIEKRLAMHNRAVDSMIGRADKSPGIRSAARVSGRMGSPDKEAQVAARASAQLDRQRSAALNRQYSERQRLEAKAHSDREKNIASEAKSAARAEVSARKEFRGRTGKVISSVGSSISGIGKAALAVTGLGGGALIASKLGSAVALESQQRDLAVAGKSGANGTLNYGQIQSKVAATSIATGKSQDDVTAGMREYVSVTGELKDASEQIMTFSTIASAAQTSVADVSKQAAYLAKNMGVTAKEMPEVLSTLYFQGKKGAFEIKDMAQFMPMLSAQASTLGMQGGAGVRTLGGLAQISQGGTGNPAEAVTALQNLFTQIVAKSDKLQSGEAFGGHRVSVFEGNDPTKKMHDIRSLIPAMIGASRGNVQELEKFGEIRGSRALNPFSTAYKEAAGSTKGTAAQKNAAGEAAVTKMIDNAVDAAGTFKDVQVDMSDQMTSTAAQLEILNTKLESVVQSELLPALVQMAPHIIALVPQFAKLVEGIASFANFLAVNPYTGIGLIIAGKATADLAQAGIGSAVTSAITSLIAGNAAGTAGGGVVSAIAGTVGAGANAAGGALGLGAAGTAALGVVVAGAGAVAGLGAAGYQAYKLYTENEKSGGIAQNIQDSFKAPSRASTPQEYDAQMAAYKASLEKATAALTVAATKLDVSQPNRGDGPSPVKVGPRR